MDSSKAYQIIKCPGRHPNGEECGEYIGVRFDDKVTCESCGAVLAPWSTYVSQRSRNKAE